MSKIHAEYVKLVDGETVPAYDVSKFPIQPGDSVTVNRESSSSRFRNEAQLEDKVYTVVEVWVGGFSSELSLEGVEGRFNTAAFEVVDGR